MSWNFVTSAAVLCAVIFLAEGLNSFLGGNFQWRPLDRQNFNGSVEINYRVAWKRSPAYNTCDTSSMTLFNGEGTLECDQGCSGSITNLSFMCTDQSIDEDWVSGTNTIVYDIFPNGTEYLEATFNASGIWVPLGTVVDGNSTLRVRMNLTSRPDGTINSSPITASTPLIYLQHGCDHVMQIPVQDPDNDIVRCRRSNSSLGECGGVCDAFPNATLDENNCTISYDAEFELGDYAVAIQIEDFTPQSTKPLSSIPLQFLVRVFNGTSPCSARPVFLAPTPAAGSCKTVEEGDNFTASLVAYSEEVNITEFLTISPPGLQTNPVTQKPSNTSIYFSNVTWSPTPQQSGVHIYCYSARNSDRVTSQQKCITLLVGGQSLNVLPDSISPSGQVIPTNFTIWTMEFDQPILRPSRSSFISLYEEGVSSPVLSIDASNPSDVMFPLLNTNGTEINFTLNYLFVRGRSYYILLDAGVARGDSLCNPDSLAITNNTFWTITLTSGDQTVQLGDKRCTTTVFGILIALVLLFFFLFLILLLLLILLLCCDRRDEGEPSTLARMISVRKSVKLKPRNGNLELETVVNGEVINNVLIKTE